MLDRDVMMRKFMRDGADEGRLAVIPAINRYPRLLAAGRSAAVGGDGERSHQNPSVRQDHARFDIVSLQRCHRRRRYDPHIFKRARPI